MSTPRKSYPSDVTDEEWAFAAPYLTLMVLDAPQRTHDLREVFNALRWLVRTGAMWRYLPHDFPPWPAVSQRAQRGIAAGCCEEMAHDLRALLREAAGRDPDPTAVILDGKTRQSTPESGHRAIGHKLRSPIGCQAGFLGVRTPSPASTERPAGTAGGLRDRRAAHRTTPGARRSAAHPTKAPLDNGQTALTCDQSHRAGYDGHKKRKGSKIHAAVDTLGHLLALTVTPANAQERAQVEVLAEEGQEVTGNTVELAWVDQGDTGEEPAEAAEAYGIEVAVGKLPEAKNGFVVLPRRWVGERSFAWASRFRRLAKDDERLPETVRGLHFLAFACLMLHRAAGALAASP